MTGILGFSFSGKANTLQNLIPVLSNSHLKILDADSQTMSEFTSKKLPDIKVESINNLLPPIDIRSLIDDKEILKIQFLSHIEQNIRKFSSFHAKFATLDAGVENCFGDMFYYDEMLRILKKIASMLIRFEMNLCIPVRFPSDNQNADNIFYSKLLSDLMLPNCFIALEIYPHKLRNKEEIKDLIKIYRFETAFLRVKYELRSGDIISEKLLGQILSAMKILPSRQICFFDTMCQEFSPIHKEIIRLSNIIPQIQPEPEKSSEN